MSHFFRRYERRLRAARGDLLRWSFSGRQGRKLAMETLRPEVCAVTLDCGDHIISFSPHELVGRRIYADGDFDRARVAAVLDRLAAEGRLSRPMIVLDIGANIGTQTLYFCLSGRVDRVVAVEPDPRNLFLLKRNVCENGFEGVVHIVPAAIGDFDGEAPFYRSPSNHGQSSLIDQGQGLEPVTVRVRPMATILAEAGIQTEAVGLVWMDIEGAEPMACRSMEALMARRVPLMMEYSPDIYGPGATRDFIALLARHYERCVYFGREAVRELKVNEMPTCGRQADVLMLA
jgi:FkbM family methyltransferase